MALGGISTVGGNTVGARSFVSAVDQNDHFPLGATAGNNSVVHRGFGQGGQFPALASLEHELNVANEQPLDPNTLDKQVQKVRSVFAPYL